LAAASVLVAITGGVAQAQMQPPGYGLFNPTPDRDPRQPSSFRKTRKVAPPTRTFSTGSVGQIPSYGYPAGSGAGSTGFNSTNAPPTAPATAAPPVTTAPSSMSTPPDDPSGDPDALPITAPIDAPITSVDPSLLPPSSDDDFSTPGRPPRKRKRPDSTDPYDPVGVRAGSFILKPAIELTGGYNSNAAQTLTPAGGTMLTVAPELKAQSDWSRHELRLDMLGSYTTYPGLSATPSLNRPMIDSKLAARIDVTRRTRLDLEGRFLLTTQDPNSPDLPAGLKSLPITISRGVTAGVTHSFNRVELGVSGTYDRITYADSQLTDGSTVSNADRNYDQYGLKLRGSYELLPGVKPFVEIGGDKRVHDLAVDSSGLRRDSVGEVASIGTSFELTKQLTGTASIGYATRDYQDPSLARLGGIVADGSVAWTATPLSTLTFTARSTIDESTLPGVSGVLARDFGVQLDHSLRRWLIGTLKFGYGWSDYVGSTREDQRYAATARLTYKLSREVQLKGEYRREWQTSNVLGGDYAANIFLLGLRLQR
jgi:hypothetical protein